MVSISTSGIISDFHSGDWTLVELLAIVTIGNGSDRPVFVAVGTGTAVTTGAVATSAAGSAIGLSRTQPM